MPTKIHDLIIIGSGPAGYTAAIYAARANLAPLVFEGSVTSGGALMTTTDVENFPGFPEGVTGPELMRRLRLQAETFGAVLLPSDVGEVDLVGDLKTVRDVDGGTHVARAVILAMGSEYRRLGLSSEEEYAGRGVSWCATCDGAFYKDQEIAVVGGGDSALEEATFLTRFASKVTLVHRRDRLRASRVMVDRAAANDKIDFLWNHEVQQVVGRDTVESLVLRDVMTGATRDLSVGGLFVAIGHLPRSGLVRGQVDLDDEGYVLVRPHTTLTNLPGVFAAGDLVDHTYRQAVTAAGTGCASALDAERYLADLEDAPAAEAAPHIPLSRPAVGQASVVRETVVRETVVATPAATATVAVAVPTAPPSKTGVKVVTDANFADEVLNSAVPVLVDFWAEWCGPCRLMLPVLNEMAGQVADRLVIAKLNVDENPATTAAYSVTSMPTMKVYREGAVVHTIMGAKPRTQLLAELADFL